MTQSEVLQRLIHEGDLLLKSGRYAEGEARARQVLSLQPKNPGAQYLMGLSALMQERHADALAYFDGALRIERVNPQLHFMAALCQAALGRLEDAIASYRRALQYQPEFIEARANLGYLLEHTGRIDEAAESYRRALAADPNEWVALNRLAYCERLLGNGDKSAELLRRALAMRPGSAATHNELALALLQLGRPQEALASLRAAVDADPGFVQGWANLAKLLYVEHIEKVQDGAEPGALDAAPIVAVFDRLLEFDPSNEEFRYLRDGLAGVKVARPPDRYIESFFDRFAPRFEARVLGELAYAAPEVAQRVLEPLLAQRQQWRVVDLGCGTGLSGGFVRPHAAKMAGVDLSGQMLELARARNLYDELVKSEIGEYLAGLAPGSVDLAIALDVLIYVGELDRVFEAASKALAPAGLLALTVEVLEKPGDYALLPAGRYAHARTYVESLAAGVGLAVRESTPFVIREEAGRAVEAVLYVLEKPAT